MEDFTEFMKEKTKECERHSANCVGTALYITGEIPLDSYFSRNDAKLKLSRLKNSLEPRLGYIVLWQHQGEPFHAGVIFNEEPLEIVHRSESNGLLIKKPLEEFINYISKNTGLKPIYKIPNKLKEFLNE